MHRLLSLALIVFAVTAHAQSPRWELGGGGGVAFNTHAASFSKIGDIPSCCPEFTGGSGVGPYFGLTTAFPVADRVKLHARLLFSSESGTLSDQENSFVADLRDTAKVVPATFEHTIDATLSSLGLEPLISFSVLPSLDLMAGARLGMVLSSSMRQTETLIEPADYGAYLGKGRTFLDTTAEIPNASSFRAALVLGARYVLPLNAESTWMLAPELTYQYALTPVVSDVTWNVHQLRLGVMVFFSPVPQETPLQVVPPAPVPVVPIVPPPPMLFASLTAVGVENGRTYDTLTIRVEEILTTELRPLVPFVFFAEGSSTLPSTYLSRPATFNEGVLRDLDNQRTHDHVLNVIGERMQASPRSTITLTGCTAETASDKGLALAAARANAVKERLMRDWGIAPNRIAVDARELPAQPTKAIESNEVQLAHEENQRVEITSSDAALLSPIRIVDTAVTATPPMVAFTTTHRADAGVASWQLTAQQDTAHVFSASGRDSLPSTIQWELVSARALPRLDVPVTATLTVKDRVGGTMTTPVQALPTAQVTLQAKRLSLAAPDTTVDTYQLILFAFDDATISGQNADILRSIRESIVPGSRVVITGQTDAIGAADHNLALSRRRAEAVARQLNAPRTEVRAVGESSEMGPLTTPVGRFHNRTVQIRVFSPVK
jgi:outer membrane protein OmpA-like peptidoglycan-associated protein